MQSHSSSFNKDHFAFQQLNFCPLLTNPSPDIPEQNASHFSGYSGILSRDIFRTKKTPINKDRSYGHDKEEYSSPGCEPWHDNNINN